MQRHFESRGIPWGRVTALRKLACQGSRKNGRAGLEYADLMELVRSLTRDHRSVEEIFRRAVFNIVAANDDAHGRNHAFLMDANGDWPLATYPLVSGFRAARVNGTASEIHAKDLIRLGQEHEVRNPADVIEQVVDSVTNWNQHAINHGISSANSAIVEQQHRLLRP